MHASSTAPFSVENGRRGQRVPEVSEHGRRRVTYEHATFPAAESSLHRPVGFGDVAQRRNETRAQDTQETDSPGFWQQCDYIRIEATPENEFFMYGAHDPTQAPGVTKFISAYTTLETGALIVAYFFLLHYWRFPYCLPLMVSSQLFLQFVLLFYSDYFCRLAYTVYWRCPGTHQFRYCFCSICDWLLVFSYFVSWCAALIILAPVFSTWRKITVFPPAYDLYVSSMLSTPLERHSFLYFHPSVSLNQSTSCAMLLPTTALVSDAVAEDHILSAHWASSSASAFRQSLMLFPSVSHSFSSPVTQIPLFLSPQISSTSAFINLNASSSRFQTTGASQLQNANADGPRAASQNSKTGWPVASTDGEAYVQKNQSLSLDIKQKNYAHRLWPNMWLGTIPNATVGAALLSDNWIHRTFRYPFSQQSTTSVTSDGVNVWAVCSDAATLGCGCHGLTVKRITDPPRCETGGFCGLEMIPGMASRSSVVALVTQAKKLFSLRPESRDIFICLQRPEPLCTEITQDVRLGVLVGLPFAIVFTFVTARLFYFHLCQAPISSSQTQVSTFPIL